ncbi:MAG: zinc-ribbon and DUF3426 domain-containing protein [Steroidobacteraceae bacterium]
MFTLCPKCALTLAVTAADLRVGQGYVRCGRCSNVFNALLTLSEEPGRPAPTGNAAAPRPAPPPPPPAEALNASEPSPAQDAPAPPAEIAPELTEHDVTFVVDTTVPPATEGGSETREYRDTGTFETIVLEGDGITQTEEVVPEEAVDSQIAAIAQQIGTQGGTGAPSTGGARAVADLLPSGPAPAHRLAWGLGAAALLLLLAGQAVHHWRNDLATTTWLNTPLTRSYAALGMPLTPRWNLGEYEVNQLGAESDATAGAAINVRLSVMNHAERAQPAPIVRLTLLDRYGKRLAARDLAPREYLKSVPANGFLAAGQRLDAQVAVRDPGPEASSFELDVCLPGPAGSLRCASDTGAAASR